MRRHHESKQTATGACRILEHVLLIEHVWQGGSWKLLTKCWILNFMLFLTDGCTGAGNWSSVASLWYRFISRGMCEIDVMYISRSVYNGSYNSWQRILQLLTTDLTTLDKMTNQNTVILQIFGEVLFSVVKGFTETKETPKLEKCMEWSWQYPLTPTFKLNQTLRDRSPPKFWRTEKFVKLRYLV